MVVPQWKLDLKSGARQSIDKVQLSVPALVDREAESTLPEGTLRFVMNEETPDRGKDLIHVDGYRLENFERNPIMPWNHDYSSLPVGRWSEVHVQGKALIGLAEFVSRDIYPFAWTVYEMYRERIMNANSVGIQPIKWAWNEERGPWCIDYLVQDLLECSAVLIGQHQNALQVRQAKAAGIDIAPLLAECRRLLDEHTEGTLWLPRSVMEELVVAENSRKVFDLAGAPGRDLYRELRLRLAGVEEPEAPEPETLTTTNSPSPPPASPQQGALSLPVESCSACGQDHDTVDVHRRGADGEGWTHWGACPKTGDPIYLEIRTLSSTTVSQRNAEGADEGFTHFLEDLMGVVDVAAKQGTSDALTAVAGELHYDDE